MGNNAISTVAYYVLPWRYFFTYKIILKHRNIFINTIIKRKNNRCHVFKIENTCDSQ